MSDELLYKSKKTERGTLEARIMNPTPSSKQANGRAEARPAPEMYYQPPCLYIYIFEMKIHLSFSILLIKVMN